MVDIYKINQRALLKHQEIESGCWISIQKPDECDFTVLSNMFGVPDPVLDEINDPDEMARLEMEEGYTLFILRVPIMRQGDDLVFQTVPLWLFFFAGNVVTVCPEKLDYLFTVFARTVREYGFRERENMFLRIYLEILEYFQSYLRKINEITQVTEKDLNISIKKNIFIRIMQLEKSLVYFTTALKSNERILFKLTRMKNHLVSGLDEELKDQVQLEQNQASEMTNIYSTIISNMVNTFESVISNNLNSIMKRLTSISLVLMVPTFIASVYGMNVKLPLATHPFGFVMVMGGAVVLTLGTFLLFKLMRYF